MKTVCENSLISKSFLKPFMLKFLVINIEPIFIKYLHRNTVELLCFLSKEKLIILNYFLAAECN